MSVNGRQTETTGCVLKVTHHNSGQWNATVHNTATQTYAIPFTYIWLIFCNYEYQVILPNKYSAVGAHNGMNLLLP